MQQEGMISQLIEWCRRDDRLEGAMLYGSFAHGEADQYSDIDCLLYFADEQLDEIDPPEWLNQISPVALYYKNEYGNGVAIFENLVRGEFHFRRACEMADLAELQGQVAFPSLEKTILVDKTGRLAHHLRPLIDSPPKRDTDQEITFLTNSLLNWTLFGLNVLERGESSRAWEILRLLHDVLLRLVRIEKGQTHHWITPTKNAENEISTKDYARLVDCSSGLDPGQLWQAYMESWSWGKELAGQLAKTHGLVLPDQVMSKIDHRFTLQQGKDQSG